MSDVEILILEDEALIAMDIQMTLEDAGHNSISVCSSVDDAMILIEKDLPKVAVLDFNLGNGTTSVSVAEKLSENGVPFIFLSGYTESTVRIPDEFSSAGRLAKPFQSAELVSKVRSTLKST